MDLKITVYRSSSQLLEDKPCFRETIQDIPEGFGYANLVLALKSVFGDHCIIQFCII